MASIGSKSRFALLHIDDDSDEASAPPKKGDIQDVLSAKKKQKKKKKNDNNNADLQDLAYGKSIGKHHKQNQGGKQGPPSKNVSDHQWQEWKKADTEFASDVFEKDLQQALVLSKLEMEQQAKDNTTNKGKVDKGSSGKDNKRKKKKEKHTMSLEEFNKTDLENRDNANANEEENTPLSPILPNPEDKLFFDKVDKDVTKIIKKEKIHEEYKKHYAVESAMSSKYQDDLKKKDNKIKEFKEKVQSLEDELKQVKKRNKQLCHILAQGEMKEKAEVLCHVQELTLVKDELTEQVSLLTGDLEKEKSKTHALKSELDKLKESRHGK